MALSAALVWTGAPALATAEPVRTPGVTAGTGEDEARAALRKAADTGERVEVVGARTEFETTYANPDGSSFRLEQSVTPVRVRARNGSWTKPDPTLERQPDGTLRPRAAAVGVTLSGGGDGAGLVKITRDGRTLGLGWPGKLPKPVLDGASALYPDVRPGVDLRMTVTAEGFREVLVVKTPKAAADPALKKITFSTEVNRLKITRTEGGGMAAVDDNATKVFTVPPARMWDSSGAAAANRAGTPSPGTRTAPQGTAPDPAAALDTAPESGPLPGSDLAELPISVAEDRISFVPDAALLKKTDPAAFPLYIDPIVSWGEAERTLLRSDGHTDYGWDNGSDDRGKGAGKCGSWGGYYCGPGYVQRLYFEFSPAALAGKHILDATFRITEPWAFQCDPRWVDLIRTNNISSATTWSSRPADLDLLVDRNVSAGRGSLCDPDSPDAPIDFKDNPEETNENLTATVRSFAAGKFSHLTLMIRAHDETDTSAWKRFKNDATLVVDYVGLPYAPRKVGFVTGSGVACSTNAADPSTISDPTPQVTAIAQTASGGSAEARLRVQFRVDKQVGTAWTQAVPALVSPTTGHLVNQQATNPTVPQTLVEGTLYRMQAKSLSYFNNYVSVLTSGGSVLCYFRIDPTAPKAPTITPGTVYSLCTTTACVPAGGPGVKDTFTFAPAAGDTNITAYQYKWSNSAVWSAPVPTSAPTLRQPIAPPESGTYQLEVRAKDTVGRWGASQVVSFLVKEGDGPVGRWRFDEATGAAVDTSTTVPAQQDNATLGAGAVRDDRGRRGEIWYDAQGQPLAQPRNDRGLKLDGASTTTVATSGPVLETRSAYSLAAWVRLDNPAIGGTIVSQDGANFSPFRLAYHMPSRKWYFGVKETDTFDGKSFWGPVSTETAVAGVWTHVAASYDPAIGRQALYINGVHQKTVHNPGSWSSSGPLQFGRTKWEGQHVFGMIGSIDEVAVWQRILTPEEIAREARTLSTRTGFSDVELVADWKATGATGTAVADTTSGYGRGLTLAGGAALDGEAIALDGADGAATTAGPVVDETGAFTVTAVAELDRAKLLTKEIGYTGQVVGQRTADGSSWGVWFELTGKENRPDDEGVARPHPVGLWRFGRINADGTKSWVSSDVEADVDTPVRLTGVYDPLADGGPVIRLHVGHTQNDIDQAYTARPGSGDLAVGKGFSATAWSHFLPAKVREVRMWAGAMASEEQVQSVIGD
ncbi:LamG-like jellyroll fold domain-containing protein [Streptomyces sp. NPDC094448]|uniref:LamG domain-containing protein n=1 Tax=Streptomyces sp. NPDC094448 TaxID=3366063 RepID=UPI003817953C